MIVQRDEGQTAKTSPDLTAHMIALRPRRLFHHQLAKASGIIGMR